jgi:hypothetical protein
MAASVRSMPRDGRVLRLLRRPGARRWLLELAGREVPAEGERAEVVRRLNRAIVAPGEPRRG